MQKIRKFEQINGEKLEKNPISGPFWPKTGAKNISNKNYPLHSLTSIILNLNAKNQKILAI